MTGEKLWRPTQFLEEHDTVYSVIVLNTPINNVKNFISICSAAQSIVVADGGANRILDLRLSGQNSEATTPHAIVGDFDSIRDDVRQYYTAKDIPFEHDSDQYSTDFTKALKYMKKTQKPDQPNLSIVVFGGLGGRPDQAFAQLHQLNMAAQDADLASWDLYLFTDEGIIFLLEKGLNIIDTSKWPDLITESVGIIPLGKPAVISTRGLEWDVSDWNTSFGTQVSTSNHIKASRVEITTNERVLFTMELASRNWGRLEYVHQYSNPSDTIITPKESL